MELPEKPHTPQGIRAGSRRRMGVVFAAIVAVVLAGTISWWLGLGSYLAQRRQYARQSATFSGSSESLRRTVIVPTLDTPCPPHQNVIWCSSFQLAWNEIRDRVVGAPLQVAGAEEVAARLNTAKSSSFDLEPGTFYTAGGRVKDGIINKITKEMGEKFPGRVPPDLARYMQEPDGILAYSYLTASVPFRRPLRQAQMEFGNSWGEKTEVEAFGVWGYVARYEDIRRQVEVLYCEMEPVGYGVKECALDLCRDSKPYQVVVAMIEPRGSLSQTLEYVRQCVASFPKSLDYGRCVSGTTGLGPHEGLSGAGCWSCTAEQSCRTRALGGAFRRQRPEIMGGPDLLRDCRRGAADLHLAASSRVGPGPLPIPPRPGSRRCMPTAPWTVLRCSSSWEVGSGAL